MNAYYTTPRGVALIKGLDLRQAGLHGLRKGRQCDTGELQE